MTFARNRKAYYDYEILDKFEAGIVLNGPEIKSIRNSNLSISESRVLINKGEAFKKKGGENYWHMIGHTLYSSGKYKIVIENGSINTYLKSELKSDSKKFFIIDSKVSKKINKIIKNKKNVALITVKGSEKLKSID